MTHFSRYGAGRRYFVVTALAVWLIGMPQYTEAALLDDRRSDVVTSLEAIGNLISSSPSLSRDERTSLLNQVLYIRTILLQGAQESPLVTDPVSAEMKTRALETGIASVVVQYDVATNVATATVTVASTTVTAAYVFPQLASSADFETRMRQLRQLLITKLSSEWQVRESEMADLVMISARNPMRNVRVSQNSPEANVLASHFGRYSIVNSVKVLPGNGLGRIEIFTDQDEALVLSLKRSASKKVSGGSRSDSTLYTYSYELYLPAARDTVYRTPATGRSASAKPQVAVVGNNIDVAGVDAYIGSLLGDALFGKTIPDFAGKLRKFLVTNPATLRGRSSALATPEAHEGCFPAVDRLIVGEFVKSLIEGIGAQHGDIDTITHFVAPSRKTSSNASCSGSQAFFNEETDIPALNRAQRTTVPSGM
jgi:hypothetical protein